jgi:hypothetical protein
MATFNQFDVEKLRLDYAAYERKKQEETKRYASDFETEELATKFIRLMLNAQDNWWYEEQVRTKSGKKVDFVVHAPRVSFAIECKRRMTTYHNNGLNATTLADYLEQAAAYSVDLGMPVFLGPVQKPMTPSNACLGGTKIDSVAALNICGGRSNVGTLIVHKQSDIQQLVGQEPYWFLFLRGAAFWTQDAGFNEKRLNMVCSTGSKKERKSLYDSQDSVVVLGSQGLQELPPSVSASQSAEELHQEADAANALRHGGAQGAGGLRPRRDPFAQELPAVPEAARPAARDEWHQIPRTRDGADR